MIAAFWLPFFRHIIKSNWLRIAFCILVVCLPNSDELASVVVNISWYIGIWAVLTAFMVLPRSWKGITVLGAAHFICILSSPSSIIIAPIWFVRLVRGFLRRDKREIAISLVVLATVGGLILFTGDLGSKADQSTAGFSLIAMFNFLATRVISELVIGFGGNLVLDGFFGPLFTYFVAALAIVFLVFLIRANRYKGAWATLAFSGVILAYLILTFVGRKGLNETGANPGDTFLSGGGRYFLLGNALFYLLLLLNLDRIKPSRFKINISAVLFTVMLLVVIQTFFIPARSDTNWSQYARQLPAALDPKIRQPLVIQIQPLDPPIWKIKFNTDKDS